MHLEPDIKLASERCIGNGIPFAVVVLPDSGNVEFYADVATVPVDIDCEKEDVFFLNIYGNRWELPLGIKKKLSVSDVIAACERRCSEKCSDYAVVTSESTDKGYYINSLKELISTLKVRRGKTVISRVIYGKTNANWTDIAEKYFSEFPNTFRALYFTPESGGWLVASPELLLKSTQSKVETMSLAGTRKCLSGTVAWDKKNIEEHNYVTQFIVDCLEKNGVSAEVGEAESLNFGAIEHLCHKIGGEYHGKLLTLINSLSPTPALAGEPRDVAMSEIASIERHARKCYGGYIGIKKDDTTIVYANLRCLNFEGENYCIYAGGGITGDSEPEREWEETENKSLFLRSLLS